MKAITLILIALAFFAAFAAEGNTPGRVIFEDSLDIGAKATKDGEGHVDISNDTVEVKAINGDGQGLENVDAATLGGQNSAYHLNRTYHTGTQLANTISDFLSEVQAIIDAYGYNSTEVYTKSEAEDMVQDYAYSKAETDATVETIIGNASLADLSDVDADAPADGEALVWNNGASAWTSETIVGDGGAFKVLSNVVMPITPEVAIATDDFVFGGTSLESTGDAELGKFFFDKSKAAFRAGRNTGTGWDDARRGSYSAAFCHNTIASGDYSFCIGNNCNATGDRSVAGGSLTTASGDTALAFGYNCTASGPYFATVIGNSSTARSNNSFAFGTNMTVGGTDTNAQYSWGVNLDATSRTLLQPSVMAIMGGKVGIGTLIPSEALEVNGDIICQDTVEANAFKVGHDSAYISEDAAHLRLKDGYQDFTLSEAIDAIDEKTTPAEVRSEIDSYSYNSTEVYTTTEADNLLDGKLDTTGTAADADKLDNQDSTYYTNRSNHTGTQLASTISDFLAQVQAEIDAYSYNSTEVYTQAETDNLLAGKLGTTATAADSDKLDNQDGTYYTNRANHTGTQAAATISDFDTEVSNNTDVDANTTARHTHSNKSTLDLIDQDVSNGATPTFTGTNISGVNAANLGGQNSAYHLSRANHTGTQAASTISDFSTAADARIAAASLDDLSDVNVGSPEDGDVLVWDNGESEWTSEAIAAGGDFSDGGDAASAKRTIGNTNAYDLGILSNDEELITLDSAGFVGVKVTDPGRDLETTAEVAIDNTMIKTMAHDETFIGRKTAYEQKIQFISTEVQLIDTNIDIYHSWPNILAVSATGQYIGIVDENQDVKISHDYGQTWATVTTTANRVACSSDGKHWVCATDGYPYVSHDYGATWATKSTQWSMRSMCMSADGKYQYYTRTDGNPQRSTDYGETSASISSDTWWRTTIHMEASASGRFVVAARYVAQTGGVAVKVSNDYGLTWTTASATLDYITDIDISDNGQYILLNSRNSSYKGAWLSKDYGATWTQVKSISTDDVDFGVGMTGDGRVQTLSTYSTLWISNDYGRTWEQAYDDGWGQAGMSMLSENGLVFVQARDDGSHSDEEIYINYLPEVFKSAITTPRIKATNSMAIPVGTSDPSSPAPGEMYYNTSTNYLRIYTGSAWKQAQFN